MDRKRIQELVKQCSTGLFDLACAVSGHPDWDLNLPVGVIDARHDKPRLTVTPVGTINSVLRASATIGTCLLYTSPSPRDVEESRMPSSA